MSKIIAIISRELTERIKMRSFWLMTFIGPILILSFLLFTFLLNGSEKKYLKILVSDPQLITDAYIVQDTSSKITYEFINNYVSTNEFRNDSKWKKYDALLKLNEKILSNNKVLFLYKNYPGTSNLNRIRIEVERRLEELKIKEFTDLDLKKYRQIKTPLHFKSMSIDSIENTREKKLAGYVGVFFAIVIFVFILIYGNQVMRSIREEKTTRIVEVLVSSVKPHQVMLGKIIGVGCAGLFQFILWILVVGIGLYLIRLNLFPDLLIPENLVNVQMNQNIAFKVFQKQLETGSTYNDFVNLVYDGINFRQMIVVFLVFFILGYILYSSIFAIIGSSISSENEALQYVIPIVALMSIALIICWFVIQNPNSNLSFWFSIFPFTSPLIVMVRTCMGYGSNAFGELWEFYLSLITLFFTSIIVFYVSSKIYKLGVLNFSKKQSLIQLIRLIKKR